MPAVRLACLAFSLLLLTLAAGCAKDDPTPTGDSGPGRDARGDVIVSDGHGDAADASGPCAISWALPDIGGNAASCTANADDFVLGSTADPYAACISDDGTYHPFDPSIGSIGRVAGFERIAALLWRADGAAPDKQAFVEARVAYTEAEGLESRLVRREDEHYPAAAKACGDMDASELAASPDRCVGPAKLVPLLNDAFAQGSQGIAPLENAARIEAALLWFLYTSVYKESTTCTGKPKDCDSSYAYYTGGEAKSGGLGLARYVRSVSTQAHERVWDGLLAVRCWRDLDGAVPATDLALRDKAIGQLDRALLRGMMLLTKARIAAYRQASCGAARAALWQTVQILGGVLDREAHDRDATKAASVRATLAKAEGVATSSELDVFVADLDALFPCP